jgi:hypothetical protein
MEPPQNQKQAFAPRVDPERLAALLDGRLHGDERTSVLAALAASPQDIELVDDVVAIEKAMEGESGSGRMRDVASSQPRWKRFDVRWGLAAAAVLIVAVALPLLFRQPSSITTPEQFGALARAGTSPLPADWIAHGRPAYRGAPAGSASDARSRSVELGTLLTDLSVAAVVDSTAARGIAVDIRDLIVRSPSAGRAAAAYDDIASGRSGLSSNTLAKAQRELLTLSPIVDPEAIKEGSWLRAAWIAATTHNSAFFADPRSRAAATSVDRSLGLSRGSAGGAEQSIELAGSGQWDALAAAMTSLLARLQH